MVKRVNLFICILLFVTGFTSCEKKQDQPDEAEILASYLESSDSPLMKDYVNTEMPSFITADELNTLNNSGQAYIIDLRSSGDFAAGHIEHAHNVSIGEIVNHMKGVDTTAFSKVAIVCHTGQNSGFAASILRLMGYDDIYSLRWGMCSWNPDFAGRWKNAVSQGNSMTDRFTTAPSEKGAKGNLPLILTGKKTIEEVLEARVDSIIAEGFTPASVTAQALFAKLTDYYIVYYGPADQYANLGHIPGAVQYTPYESMKLAVDLKTLPAGKPIAVYCTTGQTSAFLVAYLRILGYNAKSILYGASGMIYNRMVSNQLSVFNTGQIRNYHYVHSDP